MKDIEEVIRNIFEIILPMANKSEAPISYINIELGFHCEFSESSLIETFNRLKWDSPLSSADLFCSRKPMGMAFDDSIKVISFSEFEDDSGKAPIVKVSKFI